MLGKYLYIYVVDRDFGFAPNPFCGFCSLATCKPHIRNRAKIGDWIMGVGGCRLNATGKCIYLMKVTDKLKFDEYWANTKYQFKKPYRNGSRLRMVGDNIYHKENNCWVQEDSHHSNPDGSPNQENLKRDTNISDKVLISSHFYYFGSKAITVPLNEIGYKNVRSHRKILINENIQAFMDKIENKYKKNTIISDPFQFNDAHKRVNQTNGRIV